MLIAQCWFSFPIQCPLLASCCSQMTDKAVGDGGVVPSINVGLFSLQVFCPELEHEWEHCAWVWACPQSGFACGWVRGQGPPCWLLLPSSTVPEQDWLFSEASTHPSYHLKLSESWISLGNCPLVLAFLPVNVEWPGPWGTG